MKTCNNTDGLSESQEEVLEILYRTYPDAKLEEILEAHSNREGWFRALIEGAYYRKQDLGLENEDQYRESIRNTMQNVANRLGFEFSPNEP